MAEQHDETPSRIIPVAILTLTALVIAAVPMRSWTGKRRKLSHPLPPPGEQPLPLPQEDSAPEPDCEDKQGAGSVAGLRAKRTKERRRRDNKARATRIPASVQALLDQQPTPPAGEALALAPADGPDPETPMGAGAGALAIDVPLPPDSDEDSLFGFGGTESVASTNATSIPTPLSLAASEVLPPVSDDWPCPPPLPATVPSPVLQGLRKELARARMDEAEQRSAAELALKECGRMADRCELLETELGEWKRRESEAQSQIQQLLHQLRAQPQPMPMPVPMPMHYQYFPPGAPVPVPMLHMPPPQQQRGPYTPQSPMFLSPVFTPHPPPAPAQQYPRTPSPYERERDVAEAILRRPDAVLADA